MASRRVGATFRGVDGRWLRVPVEGDDVLVSGPQDTSKENAVRSSACRACDQRIRHSVSFHDKEMIRVAMRSISVTRAEGVTRLAWHAHPVDEGEREGVDHAPFLERQQEDSDGGGEAWGEESQLLSEEGPDGQTEEHG